MSDKKSLSLARVIDAAAVMFSKQRFEDVSISDIAIAAHCSSATIYDAYGTKDAVFLAAISAYMARWRPPFPTQALGPEAFPQLLSYAEARVRFLAHPTTRGLMRAVGDRLDLAKPLVKNALEGQGYFEAVRKQVYACMVSGSLRTGDTEAHTYSILAGISFESIVSGIFYGMDAPVAIGPILLKALTPHVTEAGAVQLQEYLGSRNLETPQPDDDFLPLSHGRGAGDFTEDNAQRNSVCKI